MEQFSVPWTSVHSVRLCKKGGEHFSVPVFKPLFLGDTNWPVKKLPVFFPMNTYVFQLVFFSRTTFF